MGSLRSPILDERRHPLRRCKPIGALEHARHVALIRKAGIQGGFGERPASADHSPRFIELPHGAEMAGTGAERRAKLTRQRPAIEARHAFERCNGKPPCRVRGDEIVNTHQ